MYHAATQWKRFDAAGTEKALVGLKEVRHCESITNQPLKYLLV